LALIIVFVVRLSKTRKFMPAGLMIIAGGCNTHSNLAKSIGRVCKSPAVVRLV
ncbi:MAG: hypothetical protein HC899_20425, partial [Leptolyngbyaceae cyanobacterium SM1_4_3]|nr:hypothetical protein [Leptolyngbyaceae cyanobacterium SM1_4_3]